MALLKKAPFPDRSAVMWMAMSVPAHSSMGMVMGWRALMRRSLPFFSTGFFSEERLAMGFGSTHFEQGSNEGPPEPVEGVLLSLPKGSAEDEILHRLHRQGGVAGA